MSPNVIGQLIAHVGADIEPLRRALDESKQQMSSWQSSMRGKVDSFNNKMIDAGKKVKAVGQKMTMYLTTSLVGMGAGAFKLEKDFEASLSKITGLVGVPRAEVNAWADDIRQLAPTFGKSANEMADALFFITSAGLRGADAMDALKISTKASVAGLGETKVIADLVTSAMNAYGSANLSAADAADILTAAVREGKAEAPELTAAMGQILPIASEMSVGFDEVAAAIAAMTRTGTDAGSASTQLKGILVAMLRPTKQAEQALNSMGTSSQQLRKTIQEDGLLKALMDIREVTNEYGEDMMAQVMPNIRALSGILDLMGANMEDNIQVFAATKNATGALDTAFKAASGTMQYSWNQAVQANAAVLQELGVTVGQVVLPLFTRLTNLMLGMADWMRSLNETTRKWIVGILALVAATGPLLMVLGMLMTSVIPKILIGFTKVVAAIGWMQVAFIKLTAVMMANPFIAAAVAIAVLGAAIYLWTQRTKEATVAEKALQSAQKEAIKLYGEEAAELQTLRQIAENANLPLERRREAIAKLNQIVPAYNAALTDEGVLYRHNTVALDNYLQRLQDKYKLQAVEGQYGKLIEAQTQALLNQAQAEAQLQQGMQQREEIQKKSGMFRKNWSKEERKIFDAASAQVRRARNDIEAYTGEYEIATQAVNEFGTVMEDVMNRHGDVMEKPAGALDAYTDSLEEFQRMLNGMELSELERTAASLHDQKKKLIEQNRWGSISTMDYTAENHKLAEAMQMVEERAKALSSATPDDPSTPIKNSISIYNQLSTAMQEAQEQETNAMTFQEIANARARQDAIQENIDKLQALVAHMNASPEEFSADFKIVMDESAGMVDFEKMDIPVSFVYNEDEATEASRKANERLLEEIKATNQRIEKESNQQAMTRVAIMEAEKEAELAAFKGTEKQKLELVQLYDDRIALIRADEIAQHKERQDQILKQIKEAGMSEIEWLTQQKEMELALFADNDEAKAAVAEYWANRIRESVEQAFVPPESLNHWAVIIKEIQQVREQLNEALAEGNAEVAEAATDQLEALQERLREITSIATLAENAMASFGMQAMQAGMQGTESMEAYGKAVLNVIRQNVAAVIAEGIAVVVGKALMSAPWPFNIALAGIAGGAAAALFNSAIPKFADGGMVYGTTVGLLGEYAGANTNPEVISPLDKLQHHIREAVSDSDNELQVHGVLAGDLIHVTNHRHGRLKRLVE